MITKDYVVINSETKLPYAQRDSFMDAVEVAKRKINGLVITRTDYVQIKKGGN